MIIHELKSQSKLIKKDFINLITRIGLTSFTYTKLYKDYYTVILTTHPEAMANFFIKKMNPHISQLLERFFHLKKILKPKNAEWIFYPFNVYDIYLDKTLLDPGILTIARINNFFANYELKNRIHFFKEEIDHVVMVAITHCDQNTLFIKNNNLLIINLIEQFRKEYKQLIIQQKKYIFHDHIDNNQISNRETECLPHFLKHKTAKETANIMGISSRTVETHLRNIKNKIGIQSKSQLFNFMLCK